MGAHCCERPRVSLSDKPAAARGRQVPFRVRAGAFALLRTAKPHRPVRLDPIPDQYLPARGLASPHLEHVDALDFRPRGRGPAWAGPVHAVLSVLRYRGQPGACPGQPRFRHSRARRIRRDRGRDRRLCAHVSGGEAGGDGAGSLPAAVLRGPGPWLRDDLARTAGDPLGDQAMGGVAWWAHIGGFVAGWLVTPFLRRRADGYRNYYRDEGIYGFLPDGRRQGGQGPWT